VGAKAGALVDGLGGAVVERLQHELFQTELARHSQQVEQQGAGDPLPPISRKGADIVDTPQTVLKE
jgi:hypothetical protein